MTAVNFEITNSSLGYEFWQSLWKQLGRCKNLGVITGVDFRGWSTEKGQENLYDQRAIAWSPTERVRIRYLLSCNCCKLMTDSEIFVIRTIKDEYFTLGNEVRTRRYGLSRVDCNQACCSKNLNSWWRKDFLEVVVMRTYRTSLLWHQRQTARYQTINFHSDCGSACEYEFIRFEFSVIRTSYTIRILCDMVHFWLVGAWPYRLGA